ncbi:hypothetical protein ACFLWO_04260 [Chloroflexota bacterium]
MERSAEGIKEFVKELGIDAIIEDVEKIIMEYPILTTPGLVPNKAEVTTFMTTALDEEDQAKDSWLGKVYRQGESQNSSSGSKKGGTTSEALTRGDVGWHRQEATSCEYCSHLISKEDEMSIKINIDPHLLENHSNNTVVEVSGNTIGECLGHLVKQLPTIKNVIFDKDGNLSFATAISVNLEALWIDKLAEPVKDGDEISISLEEAVG